MNKPSRRSPAPLKRLADAEIEHLLRGFSETAISSAQALRIDSSDSKIETCLFGILTFYLPAGAEAPKTEFSGESRLRDDLGLDSLSLSEAMFKIEELFDIRVENAELAEVLTIADARRLLMGKLAAASSSPPSS